MDTIETPTEITGIFVRDRHGWADFHYLSGYTYISSWVKNRLHDIPDGAIIKVSVEIIDPHPDMTKPRIPAGENG